ncbi:MAG: hypothetical protein PF448_08705, partial [Bacteroidales bacterium]|nr:hypothetical protein [Bacteroidales bacterium]
MKNHILSPVLGFLSVIFLLGSSGSAIAQLNLSMNAEENTICDGIDCSYEGPSILINEILASPTYGDGSIYGTTAGYTREGEWIELYNPDQCEWVDISCYFLGNSAPDGTCQPGGFILPEGSIVPPQGFAIVRGVNAPAVDPNLLVVNGGNTIEIVLNDPNVVCLGTSYRLWFPNAGGWFAFYDNNGVPQDAISWNNSQCSETASCNPGPIGGCDYSGGITSYNGIPADRKTYVSPNMPGSNMSWGRVPDGGAWAYNTTLTQTYGTCNDDCIPEPEITCVGTAAINVAGGAAPYEYIWDDEMIQTSQTATGLCEGTYCVTVTDANNVTASACVEVFNQQLDIEASSNTNICSGETLLLSVNGDTENDFQWTGPESFASSNQNPEIPFTEPSESGVYSVTVTNSNGCTGEDTETVSISPTPDPDAGADDDICGMEYSLNGTASSPTNDIVWTLISGPGAADFTDNSNPETIVSVNIDGTYIFEISETYSGETVCDGSDEVSITFNEILDPTITPIDDFCPDDDPVELIIQHIGTLSSIPNINDEIEDGIIDPSIGPGTYTIVNEVSGPCATSPQSEITFSIFDNIEVLDFNDQNCVNAQSEYEVSFSIVDGSGNPTTEYLVNGNTQGSSDFLATHPSATPYAYTITDLNGCSSYVFEGFRDCNCPSPGTMTSLELINLCGNECTGASVFHNEDSIMIAGSHFEFYIHSGDHNPLAYNSTTDFCRMNFGGDYNQIYYITPVSGYDEDSNGHVIPSESCHSLSQGTPVMWRQIPTPDAGQNRDTCSLRIPLNGNEVPDGMVGFWSSDCDFFAGQGTTTHSPNMYANVTENGTCTFTWHLQNGACIGEDDVQITFNQTPVPFAGNDTIVCGSEITLSAEQSVSGSTFQWSGDANFSSQNAATTDITVGNSGTYLFTLTEYNGSCYSQDQIQVSFIPGPQPMIFSNNDSICGQSHILQVENVTGDGSWSAFVDGTPSPAFFSDNTSPITEVTVDNWTGTFQTVEFIWTETNTYQGVECTSQASTEITFAKEANAFVGGQNYVEHCGFEIDLSADTTGFGADDSGYWIISDVLGYYTPDNHTANTNFVMTSMGSFGGNADVEFPAVWTVTNGVCSDVDTLTIHVYKEPDAFAGNDFSVCGLSADLNAFYDLPAGSPDYTADGYWSNLPDLNTGSVNFNPPSSNETSVNVGYPGVYHFLWRENNSLLPSCHDKDTIVVTFIEEPIIDAGDDFDVCGNVTTLSATSSGFDLSWQPVSGVIFEDFNAATTGIQYGGYGSVTFPVTESNDECTAMDEVTVTFWRRPSAEHIMAEDDTTVCGRVFERLRAENPGDGVVGNWISDPGNGVLFQNQEYIDIMEVLNYGYYTVWWTESTGPDNEDPDFCIDTSEPFTIHFIEPPQANAGTDTVFCGYSGNMNAELSINNGTSFGSWFNVSGQNIIFENPVDPNALVTSNVSTTDNPTYDNFEFVWTEENFNCTSSDTVVVGFARIPEATLTIIPPRCNGEAASIKAQEDSLQNYDWEFGFNYQIDSTWEPNALGGEYRHLVRWENEDTSHIVTLTVENHWGCSSPTVQDTIYEPYKPVFEVVTYPDTCALGLGAFEFLPDTTTEFPSFSWFDAENIESPVPVGDTIFNVPAGTYDGTHQYRTYNNAWVSQYLELFGSEQCIDEFEFDIDTAGVVTAEFIISAATDMNALVAPNAEVIFDNLSDGDNVRTSCTWYFGDGESTNSCDDQVIHVYTEPNDCYEPYLVVRVRDLPECRDTAFLECIIIDDMSKMEIPNIFTPNGD